MAIINDTGENNVVLGEHELCPDLTVNFIGTDNVLAIGPGCNLRGTISFFRTGGTVRFAGSNNGTMAVYVKGHDCRLAFGKGSRCNSTFFSNLAEDRCTIDIGDNCLFANVKFRPSDSHAIIDKTSGNRINSPEPIVIGNHVWIAEDVLILGGANVGSGSVIGARSLVNGPIPENTLSAGTPARIIREGIEWQE